MEQYFRWERSHSRMLATEAHFLIPASEFQPI